MTLLGWRFFEPAKVIGRATDRRPLMTRWTLFRAPRLGIYLHKFHRSDADFALHDHPWSFLSIILWHGYVEEFGTGQSPLGHAFNPTYERDATCGHPLDDGTGNFELCGRNRWAHQPIIHRKRRWPGAVLYRPATWRHRVVIEDETKPSWSLVFVGPRVRIWGFWLEHGWCWWRTTNYHTAVCEETILHEGGEN